MNTESYDDVLNHELTHFLVRQAIGVAMESPLREPILEGVEGSEIDEEAGPDDDTTAGETPEEPVEGGRSSRLTGAAVFALFFAVLYVLFRRLGGE